MRTTKPFGGALTAAGLSMESLTTPMLTSSSYQGKTNFVLLILINILQVWKLEHSKDGQVRLSVPPELPPRPVPLSKSRHHQPHRCLDGGKRGIEDETFGPIPPLPSLQSARHPGPLHLSHLGRPQHSRRQLDEPGAKSLRSGTLPAPRPVQSVQGGSGAPREGRLGGLQVQAGLPALSG